jgi:hypothetical protein
MTNLVGVGQNPSGKLQVLHHADWVEENGFPIHETHAKSFRDLVQMEVLFGVHGRQLSGPPSYAFTYDWYCQRLFKSADAVCAIYSLFKGKVVRSRPRNMYLILLVS